MIFIPLSDVASTCVNKKVYADKIVSSDHVHVDLTQVTELLIINVPIFRRGKGWGLEASRETGWSGTNGTVVAVCCFSISFLNGAQDGRNLTPRAQDLASLVLVCPCCRAFSQTAGEPWKRTGPSHREVCRRGFREWSDNTNVTSAVRSLSRQANHGSQIG